MTRPVCKPEVLLPAGDMESICAAVQNGADAVYFGGKDFSARQNAKNFSPAEIRPAVSYCHARGVKAYQTLNTLLFDRQFPDIVTAAEAGCAAGIDAFIVQDTGVLSLLQKICPAVPVHASTQMSVHTPAGARLLQEMGVRRVVLAREMSLKEIQKVVSSVDIETEVFVHGALCMSVSGQCYLSGMLGGRSGNRGRCAGTCRLPFSVDGSGGYSLSLKDLCLVSHVKALAEAGVTSLKIEGRMKRPEYVAAAAKAYSEAVRGIPPDMDTLQAVFSRSGFTDGYLTGQGGPDMFGCRQKEDVTAATAGLLKSLQNTYQKEHGRIPVDMIFSCVPDKPCRLAVSDPDGNHAEITGDFPAAARQTPLTGERVRQSLSKLGGTIFRPGNIRADIAPGQSLPAAEINRLRREACQALLAIREEPSPVPFDASDWKALLPGRRPPAGPPALWGRFRRYSQLASGDLSIYHRFSLPADEVISHAGSLKQYRDKLLIEPPRIMFGREEGVRQQLLSLKQQGFSSVLCNNLAHISLCRELLLEAYGGMFLNCVNSLAAQRLADLGVLSQTLSFELNAADARKISASIPLGLAVYGYLPLMALRSCPVKSRLSCGECHGDGKLIDRKQYCFRVVCDHKQYSELLNSQPLYLADRMEEFSDFSHIVLYFTVESREECRSILQKYRTAAPAEGAFTRGLYYRSI